MAFNPIRYSQQDPRWKNNKLGKSNLTLGSFGCAVSSVAMLLSGQGYPETPDSLNEKLKTRGGFMDAAIVWSAVANVTPRARFKNIVICRDNDAPIDAIAAAISAGQPVLLEVDSSPAKGLQTHWVVAYQNQGKDFLILDPYPLQDGNNTSLMQRYAQGKALKNAISAAVWYEITSAEDVVNPPSVPAIDTDFYISVIPGLAEPGLRLRSQPTTASDTLDYQSSGAVLRVIESENTARPKIGIFDQWVRVRNKSGQEGYVAAWYVQLASGPEPAPIVLPPPPVEPPAPVTPPVSTEEPTPTPAKRLRKSIADGLESVSLAAPTTLKASAKDSANHRLAADIWNRYGGLLDALAKRLGIEPGAAVATLAIESGGQAFGADGRMIIRFENHIFNNLWGKKHPAKFAQHFTYNPAQSWTGHKWRPAPTDAWRPTNLLDFHGNQSREWEVFEFARSLDDEAAKQSISMGAAQIMGFNYQVIGYASAADMFAAFSAGEREQVIGFFDFVQGVSPNAAAALKRRDFKTFATYYNGSGQAITYGNLMKASYDAFTQLQAPAPVETQPPDETPPPVEPPPPAEIPPVAPVKPAKEKIFVSVSKSVGSNGLRMRKQASVAATLIAIQPAGSSLRVLDDADVAKPKIGKANSWLWVRDRQDREATSPPGWSNWTRPNQNSTTPTSLLIFLISLFPKRWLCMSLA